MSETVTLPTVGDCRSETVTLPTVGDCRIIDLPKIVDPRGNLTFVESKDIPFPIRRTYWVYDVPGGEKRGGHAYRELEEFVISLSGAFDFIVDDGSSRQVFRLDRSYFGLYVPHLLWRSIENFSTNSVCLILASQRYREEDYLRDYQVFKNVRRGSQ
jgi:hypothetical protein